MNEPIAFEVNDDIDQLRALFFEETAEHLARLEALLGQAGNGAAASPSDVNDMFRAIHSVKGGAIIFGCEPLVDLSHHMETALDVVRKAQRAPGAALLQALTEGLDLLHANVEAFRRHEAAPQVPAAFVARLQEAAQTDERPLASVAREAFDPVDATGPAGPAVRVFHLRLGPFDASFPASCVPGLMAGLAHLGEFALQGDLAPDAAEAQMRLHSDWDAESICDALSFFAPPERTFIRIEETGRAPVSAAAREEAALKVPELAASVAPAAPAATLAPFPPASAPAPTQAAPAGLPQASASMGGSSASPAAGENASIRIGLDRIDALGRIVEEMILTQARLLQASHMLDALQHAELHADLAQLGGQVRQLQDFSQSVRMLPIATAFGRFPRLVRELAAELGKDVQLQVQGQDTELDKNLIEQIVDPLTHLLRNAVDHGIESPERRAAAGKPARGTVSLMAAHQGDGVVIRVEDDGGGLDRGRILAKARELGLPADDGMPDAALFQLIFEPGFSTASKVTHVSGRGVGMDVVMRNIQSLGGSITIDSKPGRGTRFQIKLPLTLAIIEGVVVRVGAQHFGIPVGSIVEAVHLRSDQVARLGEHDLVAHSRGEMIAALDLRKSFGLAGGDLPFDQGIFVVVEQQGERVALFVHEVLTQQQLVVKPLAARAGRSRAFAGASMLGDGRIALVLEVGQLVDAARSASCLGTPSTTVPPALPSTLDALAVA